MHVTECLARIGFRLELKLLSANNYDILVDFDYAVTGSWLYKEMK